MTQDKKVQKNHIRSRAKYPCPAELEKLIEQYNYAPTGNLPDFDLRSAWEPQVPRDELDDEFPSAQEDDYFSELFKDLPVELQTHLHAAVESRYELPSPYYEATAELAEAYREYQSNWLLMRAFIKQRPGASGGFNDSIDILSPKLNCSTNLFHRSDGRRHLPGLLGLVGTFDDNRLKICVVETCGKAFWAKRINSETCSPKCYEKWRQPRFRQHYQNGNVDGAAT